MRRVGLVNPQTDFRRIRKESSVEQFRVFRIEIRAKLLFLLFVSSAINRILEIAFQNCSRAHRRSPTIKRTPTRESEPRFVPQKDQVRFDRKTLFHHPLNVIYLSIEGAV